MIAMSELFPSLSLPVPFDAVRSAALIEITRKNTDSIEQLTDLNLGCWRAMLDDGAELAQQLAGARDGAEAARLVNAQWRPRIEQAFGYAKQLNDILADARLNLSTSIQENVVEAAAPAAPARRTRR